MGNSLKEAPFRSFSWIFLSLIVRNHSCGVPCFLLWSPSSSPTGGSRLHPPPHPYHRLLEWAVIISAMCGADTIAKPFAGWLVDYFGSRRTLILTLPWALLGLSTFLWSSRGWSCCWGR